MIASFKLRPVVAMFAARLACALEKKLIEAGCCGAGVLFVV